MTSGNDTGSARLMLAYLGRANKHYQERTFAKQKLKIELSRLKRISTQSMKKYVRELEHSITDAIRKEQHILKHQKKEDFLHGDIRDRIKELEDRLARYFTIHEIRAQRVKLLDTALSQERQTKSEKLALIRKSLERIERIYEHSKHDRKHSREQLSHVRKHLDTIRSKVRQLEKKS